MYFTQKVISFMRVFSPILVKSVEITISLIQMVSVMNFIYH